MKANHFQRSLLFISFSLFFAVTLPRLLSYGRFLDGQIYASIARNLAEGFGSFWKPYYTDQSFSVFYEQPPLGLYLQSLAFRIFGDVYFLEAIYGFVLGVIMLILMALFWRTVRSQEAGLPYEWSPVLFFASFPIVSWMISNNMLENTLIIFVLAGSLLFLVAARQKRTGRGILFSALGGLVLYGAFLTKGFPGLFPFSLPFCAWLVYRKPSFKQMLVITIVSGVIFLICFIVTVSCNADASIFFKKYFDSQVLRSLSGKRETAPRWSLADKWFFESLVPWGIGILAWLWKRGRIRIKNNRTLHFTLLLGLCGSLPLFLSPKQMGWYMVPSFTFYAMAYVALFGVPLRRLEEDNEGKFKAKWVALILSGVLIVGALTGMILEKGKIRRNRGFYEDFVIHPAPIPERVKISAYPESLRKKLGLLADLQRHLRVSLTSEQGLTYCIAPKEMAFDSTLTSDYRIIHPDQPKQYILLRK